MQGLFQSSALQIANRWMEKARAYGPVDIDHGRDPGSITQRSLWLRLMQMLAKIARDARPQDVMVGSFDHVDRVDLNISEMLDGGPRRVRPIAERFRNVETLRV